MEDNPPSDDEVNNSPVSPKIGAKKLKLNDGSSQDSLNKDSGSSSKREKDENVDSGVSADKSESTSSDDRVNMAVEGPSNEVVNVAPSSSNVRAILLNIRRPKRGRNYRKRKTPDRDSDSNDSSRDSDDLSVEETVLSVRTQENSNSEVESDDYQRYLGGSFSEMSPSGSSSSSSETNDSYDSDVTDDVARQSDDTDSDNLVWSRFEVGGAESTDTSVLLKERPKHNYHICREIINREMGLTFPCGKTGKYEVMFEKKFYSSLHSIYRLDKLHYLNEHKGCVNSINFHPEGHLLASGSDDTHVIVWDWARNIPLQKIKTGHKSNVFQSKFLYLNAESQLNIVTCARDGQVRLLQCPPSGGPAVARRRLLSHARAAHKLHVCAAEPHVVISAAEDGLVMQCDVRDDHPSRLFQVRDQRRTIPLYSVSGHPLEPRQLAVAGRDRFVRVYDRRKSTKPLLMYCPSAFVLHNGQKKSTRYAMMHMTCAVYNHDGTEILGSYNDEDIYLFDTKKDVYDKDDTTGAKDGYTHRYSGHRNSATFKGVAFFGPKSEYIVSGSDCSYIYIWEKNSEAIVQWLKGDENGVVNCIEGHPRCPVLASSGLDRDVKIWWPALRKDPKYDGLENQIKENRSKVRSTLFHDFLPTLYTAWRGENLLPDDDDGPGALYRENIDFDGNVCTAF
ncbi:DDB1- and CUL4-associated factor 8 [Amyelois transitella]|uniref:DDB1- and CUL4-associated factor 8 n=1 Tax=Amyelois transitella TaxID=680683 RepID=UPI00067DCE4E|nr:DDB1- and CUL4-associated factor 8 [Amyelois transitella]